MRFLIFFLLFSFSYVRCKNHVKSLTESMGQEVIEIGAPVKDLPPGLEEEPAAEFEEVQVLPVSKRENRKITTQTVATAQKLATAIERRSGDNMSQEEEDRRIEKELSEIYKDNDYKAVESGKVSTVSVTPTDEKLIARQGKKGAKVNFKFQPNINDKADVERFRTSVDDISCEKRVTQRLQDETAVKPIKSASGSLLRNTIAMCLAILFTFVCQ